MKKDSNQNGTSKMAAFIRGINVGGHTIIKMDELKKIFESLGYSTVKTILASGNVIFQTHDEDISKLSHNIESKLTKELGKNITVIVRTVESLRELVLKQPFEKIKVTKETRLLVTFIPDANDNPKTPKEIKHNDFFILQMPNGIICSTFQLKPGLGTSEFMNEMEKQFGKNITTRTWNTIIKILKAAE